MSSLIRNDGDGALPARKAFAFDLAEERNLVRRLKARDPRAMAELYDRFSSLLYTIILRRVTDRRAAENILEEVFLRIWNRVSVFDESQGTLTVWMVAIARNSAIEYLREW